MSSSQKNLTLNNWWDEHHELGGSVYTCDWPVQDYSSILFPLFESFYALPFEEVLEFSEATVTDNEMPNRTILEDASKIYYLAKEIKDNGLNFPPQLIHEPWENRYRVHPGSGRLLATYLCGHNVMSVVYTHFDEPLFTIPSNSEVITTAKQLQSTVKQNKVSPHYETFDAFKKFTLQDTEWKPMDYLIYEVVKPWKFIRYSEGPDFLEYKTNWRECAIELWQDRLI